MSLCSLVCLAGGDKPWLPLATYVTFKGNRLTPRILYSLSLFFYERGHIEISSVNSFKDSAALIIRKLHNVVIISRETQITQISVTQTEVTLRKFFST